MIFVLFDPLLDWTQLGHCLLLALSLAVVGPGVPGTGGARGPLSSPSLVLGASLTAWTVATGPHISARSIINHGEDGLVLSQPDATPAVVLGQQRPPPVLSRHQEGPGRWLGLVMARRPGGNQRHLTS